jgi:hypothetical protein
MVRTWQMVKTLLTSPGFQVPCAASLLADSLPLMPSATDANRACHVATSRIYFTCLMFAGCDLGERHE